MKTQKLGQQFELQAQQYLENHGLHCVATNYHCRYGEIDLVMMDGDIIVFVEVRFRSRADFGGAIESINYSKQRKLFRSAQNYLQYHRLEQYSARIDIIAMDSQDCGTTRIEWIQNAIGE